MGFLRLSFIMESYLALPLLNNYLLLFSTKQNAEIGGSFFCIIRVSKYTKVTGFTKFSLFIFDVFALF
ncbi:hypothetical protein TRIP_D440234 [uncultured Paludibacter sp.]|nr:hypothetical protein TRIP_D440234 [uncultured Paludibacter sp.]